MDLIDNTMQKRFIPPLIVTGVIVLSGIIGFAIYLRNQSFQQAIPSLSPAPLNSIPLRARSSLPTNALTEDNLTPYSIDELKRATRIYDKPEMPFSEEFIFTEMQKIVKSFPGYRYDRMDFEMTVPAREEEEETGKVLGYDIQITGVGIMENNADSYNFWFNLYEGTLTKTNASTERSALPETVKQEVLTAINQDSTFRTFQLNNPQFNTPHYQPAYSWSAGTSVPILITFSAKGPCKDGTSGRLGCTGDLYSASYDFTNKIVLKSPCPNACQATCSGKWTHYGSTCSPNTFCCVSGPQ